MWTYTNPNIKSYFDLWSSAPIGEVRPALENLMEAIGEDPDTVDVDDRFEVDWTNSQVYSTYDKDVLNNPTDAVYDVLYHTHSVFYYDSRLTFARTAYGHKEASE